MVFFTCVFAHVCLRACVCVYLKAFFFKVAIMPHETFFGAISCDTSRQKSYGKPNMVFAIFELVMV